VNLLSNFSTVDITETCLSNCRYLTWSIPLLPQDSLVFKVFSPPKFFQYFIKKRHALVVNSMRKRNCSYTRDFYQLFRSLRHTGMVFLVTEVPVWFIPVQGSAGMAYHLVPSHFEHWK